eukprot:43668_1
MSTNNRNPLPLVNTDDALENLRESFANADAGTTFSHPDMSSLLESLEANIIDPRWSKTKPYWENIRDRVNVMCTEGIVFCIVNFGEIWCNIPGMPNEGLMTLHLHDVMGGSRQQWIHLQEFVYKTEKQLVDAMKKDPIHLTHYKPLWYEICKHRSPGKLTVPRAKRKRQNTTYKSRRNTMNFIMKNAQPINNIHPPLKRFKPNHYKPSLQQPINIPPYHQPSPQFGQVNQAQLMEQFAIFQSIQQQQMLSAFQQKIQNAQKQSEEQFQREQSLIDYEQQQLRNSQNESAEQYAMQQSLLPIQSQSRPPSGKYVNYNYKSGESGSFESPVQNNGAQYNDIFEYNEMNGIHDDDTEKNNIVDSDFDMILKYNTDNNIENVETVTPKTGAVITPQAETFSPLDNAKQIVIKLKENKIDRKSIHYRPSKYIGFSMITLISGDDEIDFSLKRANNIRSVLSWLWKGNNNEEKHFHMGDAQCEKLITKTNGVYVVNAELKEFVYNNLRDSELWKDCKKFMKEVAANGKKKKTRKKTNNTNVLSAVPPLE